MLPESSDKKEEKSDSVNQPDPGTKNTTDPQEHMEGPMSSLIQSAEEGFRKDGGEKGTDSDE